LPLGVELVDETDIVAFLGNPRFGPATRNIYWRHLSGFYSWCVVFGHLDRNPMLNLPRPPAPPGEPRPLTGQQIRQVLTGAGEPYRTCFVLALYAGLRACEIAALRREDITEDTIYLRVAKGGRRASVPTAPEIWAKVRDLPPGSIVEHLGGVADAKWVSLRCAGHFRYQLGLPGVALHRGRHTFAFALRAGGADSFTIQRAGRWKSLSSVQVYVQASEEECRTAIRSLPLPRPESR